MSPSDDRPSPDEAYAVLHERVVGQPPAPGDRALSVAQYDAARQAYLDEHGIVSRPGVTLWPPTSQTIMKRLGGGSWSEAMRGLGLAPGSGRRRGAGLFDDEAYLAAVTDFVRAVRDPARPDVTSASFAAYGAWAAAEQAAGRRRPSAPGVRRHYGHWERAKDLAENAADAGPDA